MPARRHAAPLFVALAALAVLLATPVQSEEQPAPATPAPAAPASPPAEAAPAPAQNADAFGEEVTMTEKTIVFMKGSANWDNAFETLVDAFKSVLAYLEREKIKPAGQMMTIYTATDDTGFQFEAAVPVEEEPKTPPKGDINVGKSPSGKALKFVHRGSYDAMDATYEAITNHLDERKLEAKDLFIEQYVTDPLTTPEDKLVVEVYVPIR